MDLVLLSKHPELLDKKTLFELRSLVAQYPYYQIARLLLLKNLYLLHDPYFGEELRRSALYITDRKVLFDMVEAAHYSLRSSTSSSNEDQEDKKASSGRTISLIDQFLEAVPEDKEESSQKKRTKRKPTPADATIDYISYLLDSSEKEGSSEEQSKSEMKHQDLIDSFIQTSGGKIQLKDEPEFVPESQEADSSENEDDYFTETLAQIYIRQGRYSKALEIITLLNLKYPEKSAYFADQIRFLKKLIINDAAKNGTPQPLN